MMHNAIGSRYSYFSGVGPSSGRFEFKRLQPVISRNQHQTPRFLVFVQALPPAFPAGGPHPQFFFRRDPQHHRFPHQNRGEGLLYRTAGLDGIKGSVARTILGARRGAGSTRVQGFFYDKSAPRWAREEVAYRVRNGVERRGTLAAR